MKEYCRFSNEISDQNDFLEISIIINSKKYIRSSHSNATNDWCRFPGKCSFFPPRFTQISNLFIYCISSLQPPTLPPPPNIQDLIVSSSIIPNRPQSIETSRWLANCQCIPNYTGKTSTRFFFLLSFRSRPTLPNNPPGRVMILGWSSGSAHILSPNGKCEMGVQGGAGQKNPPKWHH